MEKSLHNYAMGKTMCKTIWPWGPSGAVPAEAVLWVARLPLHRGLTLTHCTLTFKEFQPWFLDGVLVKRRRQRAGIRQGCPLSTYFLGILMSVAMERYRELAY